MGDERNGSRSNDEERKSEVLCLFKGRPHCESMSGQGKATEFLKAGKLADIVKNCDS
jgi:hypothetical protein